MKILIFVLGSRGAEGHFSGAHVLAQEFFKKSKKNLITIASDDDFGELILNKQIKFIKIAGVNKVIGNGLILNGDYLDSLNAIFKKNKPNVVIFETFLPDDFNKLKFPTSARKILILKTGIKDNIKQLLDLTEKKFFDDIVVLDDVDGENRRLVTAANKHLGRNIFSSFKSIIKPLKFINIENVRTKYSIGDGYTVLVTVGGGGYVDNTGKSESVLLVDLFNRVYDELKDKIKNIKFIILSGYFSDECLKIENNFIIERHENNFMELLGLVDLAISQAGVNTVNEIRMVGVPTIFIPAKRSNDDQYGRVQKMMKIRDCVLLKEMSFKGIIKEIRNFHSKHLKYKKIQMSKNMANIVSRNNDDLIEFLLKKA
jgi:UDP-N-acetylglucosamine:LPS N-acetylglucosamine transferase